jgi:Tol biopolymer transport system component
MSTVVRSIGLSYSGNLVVFSTQKPVSSKAGVYVQDLREFHNNGGKFNPVLQANLEYQSNACLFSHLDDTIVFGSDYDGRPIPHVLKFRHPTRATPIIRIEEAG